MMRKTHAIVRTALTKGTRAMDSHKLNMYAGAVIGSLLFFLLLGFFSDLIYVGRGHSEHEALAFAVDVEETAAAGGETEASVDWAALVAAADPANGEKVFGKCKACHQIADGANGVGPTLWGVVGSDIAATDGYSYSDALTGMDGNWDLEHLSDFLAAPKAYAPGTKMGFAGIKKIQDRVDLIVYLNQADGTPMEMVPAGDASEAVSGTSTVEAATEAVTETVTAATEAASEAATAATEAASEAATAVTETVTAATEAAADATGGNGFADLVASADAKAGKKIFRKCRACHKIEDGKNGVGPTLWGIVNRDVASVDGYEYSDAMIAKEGDWTGLEIFKYLEDPKGVVPGTKMSFPGLRDAQDRVNVIVFLNEADGTPDALE
jgi:cytochrome c2